jgi:hypothetical protein
MTITKGLLVRLQVKHRKEPDVEEFLRLALPIVQDEPNTLAWFAVRFGRHEYGIVDFFPDAQARTDHLNGLVGKALDERGHELFSEGPQIISFDVLAAKMPAAGSSVESITKALLLLVEPRAGHATDMAEFLTGSLALVEKEPGTKAWFAIHAEDGQYGIFDVFGDNGARMAHLTGQVPRELVKHAPKLVGDLPDIDLLGVMAHKLAGAGS